MSRAVFSKSLVFMIYLVPLFECRNVLLPEIGKNPHDDVNNVPPLALRPEDIPDIPPGGGNMSIFERALRNPHFNGFWGTGLTRNCFRRKQVLFLGDSTMAETMDDLVLLLSGIGANRNATFKYLARSSLFSLTHPPYERIDLPGNITVEYFGGRRNLTISSKQLNMHLRFRFGGHHRLFHNFEGILTYFHKDFEDEFACLLGRRSGVGCVKPSIIVINSGLHDARGHNNVTTFAFYLDKLFGYLHNTSMPRPRVVWKANLLAPELVQQYNKLREFDMIAYHLSRRWNVEYVNSTLAYEIVAESDTDLLSKTSTDQFLHIGSIAKDKFHRERRHRKPYSWHSLAMSSLVTQLVRKAICG